MELRICHLYPDLLNLYGDRGNLLTLKQRCLWRGIDCTITAVSLGDAFAAERFDLVFMGGGQDYEQNLLYEDLLEQKGDAIREAVEADKVFLCICGGYQLMGQFYEEQDGHRIAGLGAIDVWTIGRPNRLIGNTLHQANWLAEDGRDTTLVGFENHSGRTYLGEQVKPLAIVRKGGGNNGEDRTEGAIYKNVYGTYSHGSFLPKNPAVADHLIETALKQRYKDFKGLENLDDTFAEHARNHLINCAE
ncbi:MAG: glutamine amidotransferase [Eubacteriales bacterium]|nr:glutamine amidotransferase [Eubacteriales bacterium]